MTNSTNTILFKNTSFAFILLFFTLYSSAQTFVGPGTDWNTASNWSPSGVPSTTISGTITINSNVTVSSIVVKNNGQLIVNTPAILTVGTLGNSASTQVVDFQNGSIVKVNTGASMIVYGLLNNSNNSDEVKLEGTVSVDGNITAGNGSTITGSGSLSSTGTVTGAGTVFGSGTGCTSGNGCNYGCSANTISADQTICSGSTAALIGNTGTGYSYQWQSSTTSMSTGFSNISGATSSNYTTSSLTTTTYYRRIVSVASGCSTSNSNVIMVNVNAAPAVPTGSANQSFCSSSSPTVASLLATGTAIKWYAASSGGSALATTTALTNGTHYFATQTVSGCESTSRFDVTATINTTPAVPTGIAAQSFCTSASPTVASLAAIGSTIKWYAVSSGGSALASTTALVNGTHYYASQTVSGCESTTRFDVTVTLNAALSAPATALPYSPTCSGFTAQWAWTANATTYYLDVATDNGFTNIVSAYNNINVGNVTSYDLTGLNPATTYYYRVRASGCGTSANSATMNYSTSLVSTVAPVANAASSPGCSAVTVNWSTVANATGYYLDIATDSGFTSFVSGYNNYDITYSTTNFYAGSLPAGTLYYRLRAYNDCGVTTVNSNIISFSTSTPSTPTVGTITQPCGTDGSVVLSGLPASGIVNQTGNENTSYVITGTTMTITGLAAGTYNFTASNGSCSSSATGNVVINAAVTNTWTTSWSNGTPNSSQNLVFSGIYPPAVDLNVDLTACTCMITGAATVTIKSGRTLTVTNEVTVIGGGTLTFENDASLVQTNNAAINLGNITYKRTTSSARTSDYTYWSSPVANQNLNISSFYGSGTFYSYNDFAVPEDWKKETASTIMQIGKGYIIRGPQVTGPPPPPGLVDAIFVGVPNNGEKTIAIGPTGTSNLLGNPYPSALDADAFLATNSTIVEGTIYFWTHNTAIQLASNITNGTAGTGALAYTSDDYASYNGTGGVASSGGIAPTGKIAAGQAFFTTSLGAGTVIFNNNMRVFGNNTQFFKTKNPNTKIANSIEKNRIWLNLTNAKGAFKQTLIGYVTDATNEYDSRFDGESFDGQEFIDFYSINQDKNLVIQGRALPFDENDEVALGFRSTIESAFTININKVDGLLANQPVFIEDKWTNTVFNLKSGNYTFNTLAGTFNDRFVLRYTNKTLSTNDLATQLKQVLISVKNKQIKINSFSETIEKVTIYDVLGRQIYQNGNVNNNEFLITNLVSSHQTLIVKTSLQNGKTVTDKIIY